MIHRNLWQELTADSRRFLLVKSLLAGYFTWPFWYGFATERMSPSEFGMYIAAAYVISLLAEVPTGAFADRFGRRKSTLIGILLASVYGFIAYFGRTFEFYVLSALFSGIGAAFISGSLESLLYESRDMTKELFRKVMTIESLFWQSGLIVSTAVGGWLFGIHQVLPFAAQAVSFLAAFLLVLYFREPTRVLEATDPVTFKEYFQQNRVGFMHLFEVHKLWSLLVFGVVLSGTVWVGIENLNEAAMIQYGFEPGVRGLILSITKLVVLVSLASVVLKHVKSDAAKLRFLYITLLLAFLLFAVGSKQLFLAGFLLFNFVSSTMDNFIRPILHDHLQNKYRATAISAYSFLVNIFVAVASLFVGVGLQATSAVTVQRYLLVVFVIICSLSFWRYQNHVDNKD